MIQGDFEEYCQSCTELDPTAVKIVQGEVITIIHCRHKTMCKEIYKSILKEMQEKEAEDESV